MAKRERTYEQIQALQNHPQRCVEDMIPTPGLTMHYHRCKKIGKVERDGKWYCNTHDPIAKAKRSADQEARWTEESKERQRKWALESCGAEGYELAKLCRDTFMIGDDEAEAVLDLARKIIAKAEGGK